MKQTRGRSSGGSGVARPSRASASGASPGRRVTRRSSDGAPARLARPTTPSATRKPARRKPAPGKAPASLRADNGVRRRSGRPPLRRARIGVHPERRVRLLLLTGLFILSLFGAQLFRLQALDSSAVASAALKSRLSIVAVPALRGDITSSNGVVLATSVERRNVTADQSAVPTYRKKVNGVSVRRSGLRGRLPTSHRSWASPRPSCPRR